MDRPDLGRVVLSQPFPSGRVIDLVSPVVPHLSLDQSLPARRKPRRDVHAVGDARARDVVRGVELRIELQEHLPCDLAVLRTDAVNSSGVSYREGGGPELVLRAIGRMAQSHQTRPVHAKHVFEARQVRAHHLLGEVVVPCGHRRVRREDGRVADVLERFLRP